MTRLARTRIDKRAFVKTTMALLTECTDFPKFARIVKRIDRARDREFRKRKANRRSK